jgi:hypothetical protein
MLRSTSGCWVGGVWVPTREGVGLGTEVAVALGAGVAVDVDVALDVGVTLGMGVAVKVDVALGIDVVLGTGATVGVFERAPLPQPRHSSITTKPTVADRRTCWILVCRIPIRRILICQSFMLPT